MEVDSGAELLSTLLLMFFGALLAGSLPYFLRVREAHLQTVAALGGGLLIGSALAVIIPEGFHAFAKASGHDHHDHTHTHTHDLHSHEGEEGEEGLPEGVAGLVLVAGFLCMLLLDHLQHAAGGGHSHSHSHAHSHSHGGMGCSGGSYERLREKEKAQAVPAAAGGKPGGGSAGAAADAVGAAAAALAPAALHGASDGDASQATAGCSSPTGKSKGGGGGNAAAAAGGSGDPQGAITGLLIHCAADGLAMGAAFLSGNARLSMIIAAAMVLHKAPMAFGLSTYLMACHWPWQRAQRTLLLFAAAAPAATVATYGLLGSLAALSTPGAVALCVIFSGGTFLYAATMHILPEVLSSGSGGHGHGHSRLSSAQLVAVSLGSLLPVALSWGHQH